MGPKPRKSRKPERPKALQRLLEKGREAEASSERDSIHESGPEIPGPGDWDRVARDRRIGESERELAALRERAESQRKFLAALESQPQFLFTGDPDQIIHHTLRMAVDLVGADRGAFYRLDKRGSLRLRRTLPAGTSFDRISRTLVRDALTARSPRFHLGGEDFLGRERDSVLLLGLETVVVLPLEAGHSLMGVLYLDGRSRGDFSAGDLPILESLTRIAAGAMMRLDQLNEARSTGRRLELENRRLRSVISGKARFGRLSASSPAMTRVIDQLRRMAPLKTTLRLEGETGTGKTLFARVLHEEGPWAESGFVSINCSAIPESLLEAELFGFVRGSFTGAVQNRLGLIEQADGGTLFLDEIGDLPLSIQIKILKVLEEGEIRRIGENQDRRVDFRLIVASHRDLPRMVEAGSFREDLYYRINVLNVKIPPLRDRGEDILMLAEESLAYFAQKLGQDKPRLSPEAARKLMAHPWPGNVRQLEKCIERSLALREASPVLDGSDLLLDEDMGGTPAEGQAQQRLKPFLRRAERSHLRRVLDRCGGNITAAARTLGVSRQTLYEKMRIHDLKR